MRVAWATDVHLDFLDDESLARFHGELRAAGADTLLVGGDVGTADSALELLDGMARAAGCPTYYVLGNHDFYRGSIASVRRRAQETTRGGAAARWLGALDAVPLAAGVGLVGTDGWGDGRAGDLLGSGVRLNDQLLIAELAGLEGPPLARALAALGDEAAAHLARVLDEGLARHRRLVVLTHVPPFPEAAWHEGRMSGDDWLPYFSCVATGEALRRAALQHTEAELLVLCGHTHSAGEIAPLPNLRVVTGGAAYGRPGLQPTVIELG